jgi:hypothetical protein
MSQELEVLDQLLGGDLPLEVIAGLFPDRDQCRRAVGAMLAGSEVSVLDSAGRPVPAWRYHELERTTDLWCDGTPYRLSVTAAGAKRVS